MRLILSLLTIVLLTACATPAQQKAQNIVTTFKAIGQELRQCVVVVRQNPKYDPIQPYELDINTLRPTTKQLTNDEMPTDEETALMIDLHDEETHCQINGIQKMSVATPTVAMVAMETQDEGSKLFLKLAKHELTWGAYFQEAQKLNSETMQKLYAELQNVDRQLTSENQMELAAQQQARQQFLSSLSATAVTLAELSQQQQAINAANRPVNTTCYRAGYYTNCTTQ